MKHIYDRRKSNLLIFIVLPVLFFAANTNAQVVTDTNVIKQRLRSLADSFAIDPRVTEAGATKLLESFKTINYPYGKMICLNILGIAKHYLGEAKEALKYHEEALTICRQNKFIAKEAGIMDNYSRDYRSMGNYQKAFEIQLDALAIARKINDSIQIASILGDIGQTLYRMKYYDNSVKYLSESGVLSAMLKRISDVGVSYSSITAVYLDQEKYDSAFKYARLTVDITKDVPYESMSVPYMNLGICFDKTNQKDSALFYYSKALKISEEDEDDDNTQLNLFNMAGVFDQQNKTAEAERYYKRAFELGTKTMNLEMIKNAGKDLSELYAKKGDYKNAYEYNLKSSIASDTLLNEEKVTALAELNVKFETQQLELKNTELEKKVEAQHFAMLRNRFFIFGALLIAIIVIVIAVSFIRQSRLKSKLESMDLEQKQYRAQMNPHFIFNSMNSIQHFIVHNDVSSANRYLSEFAMLMRRTLEINAGHTISLQDEISYLDNYLLLEKMRFDDKFIYNINCDAAIDKVNTKILPMIIQPFIENAVEHGLRYLNNNSGILDINFEKKDGMLLCNVEDNGIGRIASKTLKNQSGTIHVSQGISLVEKRLDLINKVYKLRYQLEITDKSDAAGKACGTKVTIKFPLI